MSPRCDVLVVGGGPAGSAAACRASRAGARTILIEQKRLPRPKLCGGWVSQRALGQLEFDLPSHVAEGDFSAISLRHGCGGSDYRPGSPLGVFVDRAVFDAHLVDRACEAGTDLICAVARGIADCDGHYRVDTSVGEFRAGAVVICSGANGALTDSCRPRDPEDWSGVCLEQRLPSSFADQLRVPRGEARLFFGVIEFGFGWVLHHGPYLVVGLGGRRHGQLDIRATFDRFWNSLGLPTLLQAPKGHMIPLGGFRRRIGSGRILCAGDAAGMVDAFSGEGIATALESGQLAAEAILTSGGADAAAIYEHSCRKALQPEMSDSLRTARLFHAMPSFLIHSFCRDQSLIAEYDLVMQRKSNYTRLLRRAAWRFVTGENKRSWCPVNTYDHTPNPVTGRRAHAL